MPLLSKKDMKLTLIEVLGRRVRISSINRELYIEISRKTNEVWSLNYEYHNLKRQDGGYGISLRGMCNDALDRYNAEVFNLQKLIKENAKHLTFYKD